MTHTELCLSIGILDNIALAAFWINQSNILLYVEHKHFLFFARFAHPSLITLYTLFYFKCFLQVTGPGFATLPSLRYFAIYLKHTFDK